MLKKNLLILFPDEWLSHSPTILNLVSILKDSFNVLVLATDDGVYSNASLRGPAFRFIKINKTLAIFFLRRIRFFYGILKSVLLLRAVRGLARHQVPDTLIGVDSIGLWVAQRVFGSAHFLSLEVNRDFFFRSCRRDRIRSLAIQSKDRAEYLFKDPPRTFLLPNAPFLPQTFPGRLEERAFNGKMIFLGLISPQHGIYACLDAMGRLVRKGATLRIKGVLYKTLVRRSLMRQYRHFFEEGTITLDEEYLDQADLIPFLSEYSVGFCFYDFNRISRANFNYLSSPSGKLYNYYAAGVPVIGTDVIGLRSVREFKTGLLLRKHTPEAIEEAYDEIARNFDVYRQNCLEAARHFDFERAATPYREFLKSGET